MRIGILGSGVVARTLGTRLVAIGHELRLGSRTADNPTAAAWAAQAGPRASHGTFDDAARFGELVLNCTAGTASLDALGAVAREALDGKILVDVANPLDFSRGMPPTLTVCNTDSLGEQLQRARPEARVVKALNTVNCEVMVDPARVPGEHDLPLCGNDADAKAAVQRHLHEWFGWRSFIDLGDISAARGMEMYLALWVRLLGALGTPYINVRVQGGRGAGAPSAVGEAAAGSSA